MGRLWLGLKLRISDHHQVTSLICPSHDLYGNVSWEQVHMKPTNAWRFIRYVSFTSYLWAAVDPSSTQTPWFNPALPTYSHAVLSRNQQKMSASLRLSSHVLASTRRLAFTTRLNQCRVKSRLQARTYSSIRAFESHKIFKPPFMNFPRGNPQYRSNLTVVCGEVASVLRIHTWKLVDLLPLF